MSAYEVDAATMCDALSHVPGVEHVVLEFDESGDGLLRVQVGHGQDHASIVGAAVNQMRAWFGLADDEHRLRLTGPAGRPVVAVVETLDEHGSAPHDLTATEPDVGVAPSADLDLGGPTDLSAALTATLPVPATSSKRPAGRHRSGGPTPVEPAQAIAAEPAPREPSNEPSNEPSERVVVERVVLSTEHQEVRASVLLRLGTGLHEGIATRPATGAGAHRALAAATASAVQAVVSTSARLEVDQVDLLQVGPDHVAVVVLSLLTSQGIDRLTGSALVRSDARDAVVRATLDALNRRAGIVGRSGGAAA